MPGNQKLLIVWVYYEAMGHFVEAIAAAAEYKSANPELDIYVVLNRKGNYGLVKYCPWISGEFDLDVESSSDVFAQLEQNIPKEWDYVVFPASWKYSREEFYPDYLRRANEQLEQYFTARRWHQYQDDFKAGPANLPFGPFSEFRLELGPPERAWASRIFSGEGPLITVMLEGASPATIYPSLATWRKIIVALKKVFPAIEIAVTGVSRKNRYGFYPPEQHNQRIRRFIDRIGAIDCMDIGLDRQLALMGASDMFMSPHTGFAFLAPCVGTPWLTLSGGQWSDATFAGVPFYAVMPACNHYPCHGNMKPECKLRMKVRQPVKCMSGELVERKDEIVEAVQLLMKPEFSLDHAYLTYRDQARIKGVDFKKLWRMKNYFRYVEEGPANSVAGSRLTAL